MMTKLKGEGIMKKRLAWVMVVAMVMSFAFAVPASAAEGDFVVHAKTDFAAPMLWAWGGDTGDLFKVWPGEALTADPDNAGWFYYSVPGTTDSVIINDNGAGSQTVDLTVEPKEMWVTVTEAGSDGKFAADVVYEAPEGFVAAAAEATDTAEDTTTTEVPKTGVTDLMYVYMGLAGLAGTGFVASKKRKNA
jgi:LPXTG-motif cell wall-anchored protein